MTLLQHFRSYLETNSNKEGSGSSKNTGGDVEMKDEKDPGVSGVYVKKWMRTKHAIMFRLSNKIV